MPAYAQQRSSKTQVPPSVSPSAKCKQPELKEVATALSEAKSKLKESKKVGGSAAIELLNEAKIYEEVARKGLRPYRECKAAALDSLRSDLWKVTEERKLRKTFIGRIIERKQYELFITEVLAIEAGVAGFLGNIALKVDNDGGNSGLASGAAMRVSVGPRIGPAVLALEGTMTFTFLGNHSAFSEDSKERADWRAGGLLRYDFQPIHGLSFAPGIFGGGAVLQRGTYVVDDEDKQLPRHAGAYGGLSLLLGGILARTKPEDPSGPARRLKRAVLSYELMCGSSSQDVGKEECEKQKKEVIAAGEALDRPVGDCSEIYVDEPSSTSPLAASTLVQLDRKADCALAKAEQPPSGFFLGVDPRVDFVASSYIWQLSFSLGVVGRF